MFELINENIEFPNVSYGKDDRVAPEESAVIFCSTKIPFILGFVSSREIDCDGLRKN